MAPFVEIKKTSSTGGPVGNTENELKVPEITTDNFAKAAEINSDQARRFFFLRGLKSDLDKKLPAHALNVTPNATIHGKLSGGLEVIAYVTDLPSSALGPASLQGPVWKLCITRRDHSGTKIVNDYTKHDLASRYNNAVLPKDELIRALQFLDRSSGGSTSI